MEWKNTPSLTPYPDALDAMAARVAAIQRGEAEEWVWLLEHPPIYTLGTSAKEGDILTTPDIPILPENSRRAAAIPIYPTGRGGQVTYHGPGQRIAYVMRDLKKHAGSSGPDLRAYVKDLEHWLILTLAEFGIEGFTREGRVGVWVNTPTGESKIAALGVRVQKWVTSHGISLNVNPNLSHYGGIVPCGIREYGVTSLVDLGVQATMAEVDAVLREKFEVVFV